MVIYKTLVLYTTIHIHTFEGAHDVMITVVGNRHSGQNSKSWTRLFVLRIVLIPLGKV